MAVARDEIFVYKNKEAFYGPITALCFITKDLIIAGEGSFLKIYSTESNSCIFITKVFKQHRIHKFKVTSRHKDSICVVVLGGKAVRLLAVCINNKSVRVECKSNEVSFGTWIWDASKVTDEVNDEQIALVTSKNAVILYNFAKADERVISNCVEQCILYSASLWGTTLDQMLVAVGTVFNEVLIWQPFHLMKSVQQRMFLTSVHKRLKGHEGVIFSLAFTTDATRLLSVSDDRSIRHWDINEENCLQVLYGHTARVWDAVFHDQFVISIGEDATCIVWKNASDMIKKFKGHRGKSIWSLATYDDSLNIATGGGDSSIRLWSLDTLLSPQNTTSYIALTSLVSPNDFTRSLCILSFKELLVLTNNGYLLTYSFNDKERQGEWLVLFNDNSFSRYSCMKANAQKRVAVIGNLNGIIRIVSIGDMKVKDKKVFDDKIFSIFILETESPNDGRTSFIAVCGNGGIIKLLRMENNKAGIDLKIKGCFVLPYCKQRWAAACKLVPLSVQDSTEPTYSLIVGDRRGSIHVFRFVDSEKKQVEPTLPHQSLLAMHGKTGVTNILSQHRWIYSTGRDGFYRKFHLNFDGTLTVLERKKACKGMDWIEGLLFYGGDDDILVYGFYMQSHFALWSTARNEIVQKLHCGGGYRSWDLAIDSPRNPDRQLLNFVYLTKEKIMLSTLETQKNQHILKESLHGREMTCICVLGQDEQGDVILATGSEDTLINIVLYSFERNEFQCIHRIDDHIGSVKSMAFLKDGTSISHQFDSEEHLPVKHVGAININKSTDDLDIIRNSEPYLLFTCGSRTSLKCNYITFNEHEAAINSSLVSEIGPPTKTKKETIDDVRFMSLQAVSLHNCRGFVQPTPFYCIIVACSDGYIRIYGFSREMRQFCLIMASNFHGRCVQVVRHFVHKSESREFHLILSGSTDGRIALWNISEIIKAFLLAKLNDNDPVSRHCGEDDHINRDYDSADDRPARRSENGLQLDGIQLLPTSSVYNQSLVPLYVFHAHQSSIHSMSIVRNEADSSYVIASGGDDNMIFTSSFAISDLDGNDEPRCIVQWTDRIVYAHHSAVTGVHLVHADLLITCSIDQRLKLWRKYDMKSKYDANDSYWTNAATFHTDVADASDIGCFMRRDKLAAAVCGVGLEMQILDIL